MDNTGTAKRLLRHYFAVTANSSGTKLDADNLAEIDAIVDHIIAAAADAIHGEPLPFTDPPAADLDEPEPPERRAVYLLQECAAMLHGYFDMELSVNVCFCGVHDLLLRADGVLDELGLGEDE